MVIMKLLSDVNLLHPMQGCEFAVYLIERAFCAMHTLSVSLTKVGYKVKSHACTSTHIEESICSICDIAIR